jgi:FlaA1/EpsC-like NDP-sugar epimerase
MTILDIARAVAPEAEHRIIGIRPGEKIHEQMIGVEDAPNTFAYKDHFKILPMIHNWSSDPLRINDGVRVDDGFMYSSDNNEQWMPADTLRQWIDAHRSKLGAI